MEARAAQNLEIGGHVLLGKSVVFFPRARDKGASLFKTAQRCLEKGVASGTGLQRTRAIFTHPVYEVDFCEDVFGFPLTVDDDSAGSVG